MYVITGAYGFIGSNMVAYLNSLGIDDIIIIDDYVDLKSKSNLNDNQFKNKHNISLDKKTILPDTEIDAVFHFGAISDTLEKDNFKFKYYNIDYTNILNSVCKERSIPLIFSSSAAVYGNGNGPLNLYAMSKLTSENDIKNDAMCLRLFNVYGPNEQHKGRMSSVMFKWFNELKDKNSIKIFENSTNYIRDFIYVQDVCRIAYECLAKYKPGVYDVGSGKSTSFEYIADLMINLNQGGIKNYIEIPEDLKIQYQNNTKSDLSKLHLIEIMLNCKTIDDGIKLYFNYLNKLLNER